MSSFVQAQPVAYGTPLGSKYPASTSANCYYVADCHGRQTVVGDSFYGTVADSARCYVSDRDYDADGYDQQTAGYGERYGQLQQQPHRMFMSEYRPHDAYRLYCTPPDQPQRRSGPSLYGGEQLIQPAGDSPSAGVVPASSPGSSTGLCSRYSPPSAAASLPQHLNNAPQQPIIYPWMKMVHSISG